MKNFKSYIVRYVKNLGKILKYTLKIPATKFNINKVAG